MIQNYLVDINILKNKKFNQLPNVSLTWLQKMRKKKKHVSFIISQNINGRPRKLVSLHNIGQFMSHSILDELNQNH